jgi:hypothetical protein
MSIDDATDYIEKTLDVKPRKVRRLKSSLEYHRAAVVELQKQFDDTGLEKRREILYELETKQEMVDYLEQLLKCYQTNEDILQYFNAMRDLRDIGLDCKETNTRQDAPLYDK